MDQVSVVIVNYNGERHLPALLTSITQQTYPVEDIIVVDNASTDRSIEVAKHFPVRIVPSGGNVGPATARNTGLRHAKHEYVLHLDNDTVLHPDLLAHLMQAASAHPQHTFFVPRTLYHHDPLRIQKDDLLIHFLGISLNSTNYNVLKSQARPINPHIRGFNGVAYLLRKTAREIADYDEVFFYGLEDVDFSIHNYLLGHRCLYVPAAEIYHKDGTPGLSHRFGGGPYPRLRLFYLARNRWFVILKNFQLKTLFLLIPLSLLFDVLLFVFSLLRVRSVTVLPHAYLSLLRNAGHIREQRRSIQQGRRMADRDLLLNHALKFNQHTHEQAPRGTDLINRLLQFYGKYVLRLK